MHIKTEHFILTPAKTRKWTDLPSKSKYKLEYAKANEDGDRQISFYLLGDTLHYTLQKDELITDPYYALLTYGYNNLTNECTHIDLVVPDASFNGILHRTNLLPATDNHFLVLHPEEEETLTALHKDLEKLVTLKTKK